MSFFPLSYLRSGFISSHSAFNPHSLPIRWLMLMLSSTCRTNYSDFAHEIFSSFHFFGHGHCIGNLAFANEGQDTVVIPAHSDVIAAQGGIGPGPVRRKGGAAGSLRYLAPGRGGRYNEWRRSHGRPKMDLAQAFRLSGSGYSKPSHDANDDGSRPSYDPRTPIAASSPARTIRGL
jgi:hypothetical protein